MKSSNLFLNQIPSPYRGRAILCRGSPGSWLLAPGSLTDCASVPLKRVACAPQYSLKAAPDMVAYLGTHIFITRRVSTTGLEYRKGSLEPPARDNFNHKRAVPAWPHEGAS